jgi:uncharacterized protein DUF6174
VQQSPGKRVRLAADRWDDRIRVVIRGCVTLGIVCAACSLSPFGQQEEDLTVAQARWRAAALLDYSFDIQRVCFCAPSATRPVTITVHQGAWATLTYADDGTTADTSLFRDFLTMDRVFSFLRRALEGHPAAFVGTYHAQLGYPSEVRIDYLGNAIDDELGILVPILRTTVIQ